LKIEDASEGGPLGRPLCVLQTEPGIYVIVNRIAI